MVSSDCTDEDCLCASPLDSEDPYGNLDSLDKSNHDEAELPLNGKVIFSLAPVVTPLKTEDNLPEIEQIEVAELAGQFIVDELRVDAISQSDFSAQWSDEDTDTSPRITSRKRRPASNENQPPALPMITSSPEESAQEEVEPAQEEVVRRAQPKPAPKTPAVMQDSYIAFGVNGR